MKLRRYMAVLNSCRATIEEVLWRPSSKLASTSFPCCTPEQEGSNSEARSFSCLIGSGSEQGLVDQGSNLTNGITQIIAFVKKGFNFVCFTVFSANLKSHPTIKSQFFVSSADLKGRSFSRVLNQSAPRVQDTRHRYNISLRIPEGCQFIYNICCRDVFFDTVEAHSKKVLILIDHGSSLSKNQLNLAKKISKHNIALKFEHQ